MFVLQREALQHTMLPLDLGLLNTQNVAPTVSEQAKVVSFVCLKLLLNPQKDSDGTFYDLIQGIIKLYNPPETFLSRDHWKWGLK